MRNVLVLLAVALIAAAYVAGRWPERNRRLALEGEARILERRIEDAEARVRMASLIGEIQNLVEVAAEKNYGQAQASPRASSTMSAPNPFARPSRRSRTPSSRCWPGAIP
jgi:hypothetical protein